MKEAAVEGGLLDSPAFCELDSRVDKMRAMVQDPLPSWTKQRGPESLVASSERAIAFIDHREGIAETDEVGQRGLGDTIRQLESANSTVHVAKVVREASLSAATLTGKHRK